MSLDWVTAMDICAAAGVVDYDVPARLLRQKPRYIGHPRFEDVTRLDRPMPDAFKPSNENIIHPKSWKKKAMKALIGIGAGLGIIALIQRGKLNISNIKNFVTQEFNIIKKPFVSLINKIRTS